MTNNIEKAVNPSAVRRVKKTKRGPAVKTSAGYNEFDHSLDDDAEQLDEDDAEELEDDDGEDWEEDYLAADGVGDTMLPSDRRGRARQVIGPAPTRHRRPPPVSPAVPRRQRTNSSPGVLASAGCGCGCASGQYVFVVGTQLGYDFGSRIRHMSLQDAFFSGPLPEAAAGIESPENLLRHLLGWSFVDEDKATQRVGGNLYDVQSVTWVLYQDGCPIYALKPQGPFADVAYKELLHFFIDNRAINLGEHGVSYDCMQGYFDCHGGRSDPLLGSDSEDRAFGAPSRNPSPASKAAKASAEAGSTRPKPRDANDTSDDLLDVEAAATIFFQESPNRASRIAIAGEITGEVELLTGDVVKVINPAMRGTSTWNTARLLSIARRATNSDEAALLVIAKLVSRLYDSVRNPGQAPEDRARNWAATTLLRSVGPLVRAKTRLPGLTGDASPKVGNIFDLLIGGLADAAVQDVEVERSTCTQTGMEFDVSITLFNTENVHRGLLVLEQTVDVSDVVPVTHGPIRLLNRR